MQFVAPAPTHKLSSWLFENTSLVTDIISQIA